MQIFVILNHALFFIIAHTRIPGNRNA